MDCPIIICGDFERCDCYMKLECFEKLIRGIC